MRRSIICFFVFSALLLSKSLAQKPSSQLRYFGDYIVTDSTSTLMIPTSYHVALFASDKMALSGQYHANMIFYNFKTDSARKLFEKDTYIVPLVRYVNYNKHSVSEESMSSKYIFYRCYTIDRNKNGKIDPHDPAVLYVSDRHGNNLTALTGPDENVVSIDIFDKQNFALVKIQRDSDNDGDFESDSDLDYYLIKLDLEKRTFGKRISAR
jgi:hypothetical protein